MGDDVTHITFLSNFSHHPPWLLLWTTHSYCNTSSVPHALCALENPAPSVWCSVCFLLCLKTPTHPRKFYPHFATRFSTASSAEVGTPCWDPTTASLYTTQYFSLSQTVLVLVSHILPDTAGRHHQAHTTPSPNVCYVFSLTSRACVITESESVGNGTVREPSSHAPLHPHILLLRGMMCWSHTASS